MTLSSAAPATRVSKADGVRPAARALDAVVEAAIARIERLNPAINAVVTLDVDRARGAADAADQATATGESFGPLHGKIWRIGAMGVNARRDAVLITLGALEAVLAGEQFKLPRGAAVDAARAVYRAAGE